MIKQFESLEYIKDKLKYLDFDNHLGCYVEKNNGMPVGLAAWVSGAMYGWMAAQPEWISVEDELPKFNEKVLVVVNDSDIYVDEYIDKGYAEHFAVWHSCVTHWMPLPNKPLAKQQ